MLSKLIDRCIEKLHVFLPHHFDQRCTMENGPDHAIVFIPVCMKPFIDLLRPTNLVRKIKRYDVILSSNTSDAKNMTCGTPLCFMG